MFRFGRISDPLPFTCGLDIGQETLRAVVLEMANREPRVTRTVQIPAPPNAVQEGVVTRPAEVAALLRRHLRKFQGKMTVALAVPIEQATLRWIDLPLLDTEALRNAARFEARRYLSDPVDQMEVQIAPLETAGLSEKGRMRALLVAAPREVVCSRAEAVERAGLQVGTVEPEAFALIRPFLNADFHPQGALWHGQPVACVHLGEKTSGLCVAQNAELRFARAIAWGGQRMTQALSEALSCTPEEARAIKESKEGVLDENGLFSWGSEGARRQTDALKPELDRLHREIHRLLNYYRSLFPERSYEGAIHHLRLSGGTALLAGLESCLGRLLQVNALVSDPFSNLAPFSPPNAAERRSASFVVAVGLAMRAQQNRMETEPGRSFRPQEFVWRRKAA